MQAYLSKSIADFPFLSALNLTPYTDLKQPALFIGCYNYEDFHAIQNHESEVSILWCGQDSLTAIQMGWVLFLKDFKNYTWLANVAKVLSPFLKIDEVNPILLGGEFTVSQLGKKVYAYCPSSFQEYHNLELFEQIQAELPQFEFIRGYGAISQQEWLSGLGNSIYDECFIGLCLSGFAGGGQTIVQMGLKGRNVITNVLTLPNCIKWTSKEDIKKAILIESEIIGVTQEQLAFQIQQNIKTSFL